MTRLAIENRITLLKSRKADNSRIIRKLERRLRKLEQATQQND